MFMTGLATVATVIVGACTIPFLSAWDAKGSAGQQYRETVKKIWGAGVATTHILAGLLCGILALVAALFDPKPGTVPGRHPRSYLYRRTYRGRHWTGTSVWRTLRYAKEPSVAVVA